MNERTGLCLSIQQPWAWLIVNGFKDLENRDWRTRVRGVFGIHAAKKFDEGGYAFVERMFPLISLPPLSEFERGGIVGRATLVDCVDDSDSDWYSGNYAFLLRNAEPLPFMPCRGMPGFFRPEFADAASEARV